MIKISFCPVKLQPPPWSLYAACVCTWFNCFFFLQYMTSDMLRLTIIFVKVTNWSTTRKQANDMGRTIIMMSPISDQCYCIECKFRVLISVKISWGSPTHNETQKAKESGFLCSTNPGGFGWLDPNKSLLLQANFITTHFYLVLYHISAHYFTIDNNSAGSSWPIHQFLTQHFFLIT